ncbi:MAG: cupin domain-containing protein [bacterium]|nr:cupin domain-containing protein [bacterium]
MIVKKYDEIAKAEVKMDGAKDVSIRWLIGEDSGAPNFHMRLFEVEPGGHTPFHTHAFEHEVFVVEGKGKLNTGDKPMPLERGVFALVLPNEEHNFENTGDITLKFLCLVPREDKCVK